MIVTFVALEEEDEGYSHYVWPDFGHKWEAINMKGSLLVARNIFEYPKLY